MVLRGVCEGLSGCAEVPRGGYLCPGPGRWLRICITSRKAGRLKNVQFRSSEQAIETLRLATEAACLGVFDWNLETEELHWSDLAKTILGIEGNGPFRVIDFAERLHPEDRDRELAHAALIQAEHLAATGRLAASIAHEINNPLEAVTNLLYLIRHERDETARNAYLLTAESELARVSEIAANTLRFYRDPKGKSRVGLSPLLHSVVGLFQGRIVVRGIELQVRCEDAAEVTASQGELRQVLVNLIGNALDAMPAGGRLTIRCRSFARTLGDLQPGAGICIADTGTGMSSDVLRRAFEPFYTTKGSAGTGLGLWLSREIAKKHGFKLLVKSKPTRGTVFGIYMPDPAAAP